MGKLAVIAFFAGLLLLGCVSPSQGPPTPTPPLVITTRQPSATPTTAQAAAVSPPATTPGASATPEPTAAPTAEQNQSVQLPKCYSSADCYYESAKCVSRVDPSGAGGDQKPGYACACILGRCSPTWQPTVTPTPAPTPVAPLKFLSMAVDNIRTSHADLYWSTNAPSSGTVKYGDGPFVRKWTLTSPVSPDHFLGLVRLSLNTTYYFEIEACANSSCVTAPVLNFTTPGLDDYQVPGGKINYTSVVTAGG